MNEKDRIYYELLVTRHKRGDASAFDEIINHWEQPLFYFIRRLVKHEEDAWDILQDVWMKVLHNLHKIREPKALNAWIYRIARNSAFNHSRSLKQTEPLPSDDTLHDETEIDLRIEQNNIMDVHKAIETLSVAHREVIVLHFLEGFSVSEISDITGKSPGTVKSRLYYAKLTLKQYLTPDHDPKGERHA